MAEVDREVSKAPFPWHACVVSEAVALQRANTERGLTAEHAAERLARHGANRLRHRKEEPWWHEALEVRSPAASRPMPSSGSPFIASVRRSPALPAAALETYSFPSGHTVAATLVYD